MQLLRIDQILLVVPIEKQPRQEVRQQRSLLVKSPKLPQEPTDKHLTVLKLEELCVSPLCAPLLEHKNLRVVLTGVPIPDPVLRQERDDVRRVPGQRPDVDLARQELVA